MPETEPRKRVADAKRHLFARIIASAHLLDKPFTDAPEQSPWTGIKRAMEGLNAALSVLDAAPRRYALPVEPPADVTELWDAEGERWERQHPGIDRWVADDQNVWEVGAYLGPTAAARPAVHHSTNHREGHRMSTLSDGELRRLLRVAGFDPGEGVWVARYPDGSASAAFPTEIEALRHAVNNSMEVALVPFGEDLIRYRPGRTDDH
jgi:hypothetical protein